MSTEFTTRCFLIEQMQVRGQNSMTHSGLGDIQSSTLLVEDENAVGDLLSPGEEAPNEKELHRKLIEQLYERSVERYGADSEQARMLSGLLKR